jgi:hypothetical protein
MPSVFHRYASKYLILSYIVGNGPLDQIFCPNNLQFYNADAIKSSKFNELFDGCHQSLPPYILILVSSTIHLNSMEYYVKASVYIK